MSNANASYPQLSNLYPAVNDASTGSSAGMSGAGASSSGGGGGRPATGPGSGFPARPPAPPAQPQQQSAYGASGGTSNSYGASSYGLGGSGSAGASSSSSGGEKNMVEMIKDNGNKWQRAYRNLLDRSTPLTVQRWLFTAAILFVFTGVVVIRQGWYIVCYALAIYLLNLFLAFLQPRFDPSLQADLAAEDVEEGAPGLPGGDRKKAAGGFSGLLSGFQPDGEEEFRPFIRRLPGEPHRTTRAQTISDIACSALIHRSPMATCHRSTFRPSHLPSLAL